MSISYTGVAANVAPNILAPTTTVPADGDADQASTFSAAQGAADYNAAFLAVLQALLLSNFRLSTAAFGSSDMVQSTPTFLNGVTLIVSGDSTAGTAHWHYSADGGTSWSAAGTTANNGTGNCVIWVQSLGLFVGLVAMAGSVVAIETCPDINPTAITWTSRTIPSTTGGGSLRQGLAFGAGLIVGAVGNTGQVITSPDGVTWNARTSTFGSKVPNQVIFAGGQFIALTSDGTVFSSPDGLAWTNRGTFSGLAGLGVGLAYNAKAGIYLAHSYVSGAEVFYSSTDGATWTSRGSPFPVTQVCTSVIVALGQFMTTVTGGSSPRFWTSPDGITWTAGKPLVPAVSMNQFKFLNGERFVVLGNSIYFGLSAGGL